MTDHYTPPVNIPRLAKRIKRIVEKAKQKEDAMSTKVAATVIIYDAPRMSKKGREQVAEWLANQAKTLFEYGDAYSKQFRARYYYKPNGKP